MYRKFSPEPAFDYPRLIEPGLLFEYRNRWYLDGFDAVERKPRTFGLDRITNLKLTDQPIQQTDIETLRTDRQHAIGVTCPPDLEPQRVVLRFQSSEANYVRSLPLHGSQQIIQEGPDFVDVELTVILNHELDREILAFGELVEVLEPQVLRERMTERVVDLLQRYNHHSDFSR